MRLTLHLDAAERRQDVHSLHLPVLEQRLGERVELRAGVGEQGECVAVGVGHQALHLLVDHVPRLVGQVVLTLMRDQLADPLREAELQHRPACEQVRLLQIVGGA